MTRPSRRFLGVRETLVAYARTYEDGITASIFAIALFVLLGMVAVGIDGSRIYDERRKAQNAADHAAIAAAFASCNNGSAADVAAAIAAGEDSADENGYDPSDPDVTVTIAHDGAADVHKFTALVDTTIGTTFGQVIGFANLSTNGFARAEATGCAPTGSGTVPAIFGGGDECPGGSHQNVYIDGNDHTVNGLSHSNGEWMTNGSTSDFINADGPAVTYVDDFEGKKPSNTYTGPEEQVSDQLWPAGFDPTLNMTLAMWEAYRLSPLRANPGSDTQGSFDITADGIYYTQRSSEITINSIADGAEFVIVSKNAPIRMGNEHTGVYHAFPDNPVGTPDNVIAVSGFSSSQPCDQMAFLRSGNLGTWNGIFWAPKATVEWSGNEGTIVGGLIGWAVKLNGNEHTINGGTGTSAAEMDVLLID